MKSLKYSEILKRNKELFFSSNVTPYNIAVLSNITVHQIKEILEYCIRTNDVRANIQIGDYDNIIQDSINYRDANAIIIMWELSNIVEGLQYNIELYTDEQLSELLLKTKSEFDFVFNNLKKSSIILINKFSSLPFSNSNIRSNNLEKLGDQLNNYLEETIPTNARLVDLDKVIASVGVSKSLDLRYFYSSKALYTIDFFKAYAEHVKPFFISANGKAKKALIFDCDNTLWKGILGEDGADGIEMSPKTKNGAIFFEVQTIARALNAQGILIGICSKNNFEDVEEVIKSHPDMQLRDKHISIIKSNWRDKATNLKEISNELNIGLDSLVFIDDSSFEVNLVEEKLPDITVLHVPERLHEYPVMLRENVNLFYNLSVTDEDISKIEKYKHQRLRENERYKFNDIEDYLASLDLRITLYQNDKSVVPRMSQMSQKTNQFNLTTKRYTETDIQNFVENQKFELFAISVSDKFGDNGITGLCIVKFDDVKKTAEIDTFLLSCRIIGRNIEFAFMDYLIGNIKKRKCISVTSKYIKTRKNSQVHDFYDKCAFRAIESDDLKKLYEIQVVDYQYKNKNYIEVIYDSE
jgi:FkbH-like protein